MFSRRNSTGTLHEQNPAQGVGFPRPQSLDLTDSRFLMAPAQAVPVSAADARKKRYEEDAFYAAKNGNFELLDLLLGPTAETLNEDAKQTEAARAKVVYFGTQYEELELKAAVLDSRIKKLEDDLNIGVVQKQLEEDFDKEMERSLEYRKGRQGATAEREVDGVVVKVSEADQMKVVDELRTKFEKEKAAYFNKKETKALIQERTASLQKELEAKIPQRDAILRDCEFMRSKVTKWNDLAQKANDKNTFIRDKKIEAIIKQMEAASKLFPPHYTRLLHDKSKLKTELKQAAAARVDVNISDENRDTLMHHVVKRLDLKQLVLLLEHGGISSFFLENANKIRPYDLAVIHSNNDLMEIIQKHLVPEVAADDQLPAFHTDESVQRMKEEELDILSNAYALIEQYRQIELPKRQAWYYDQQLTAQRRQIVEYLQDVFFPKARNASSYYLWELAAQKGLRDLKTGFFNRSSLRDVLNGIILTAKQRLATRAHPWQLANQVQTLMAVRAEHEKEKAELRAMFEEREAALNAEMSRLRADSEEQRQDSGERKHEVELLRKENQVCKEELSSLKCENMELKEKVLAQERSAAEERAKVARLEAFMQQCLAGPLKSVEIPLVPVSPSTRPAALSQQSGLSTLLFLHGNTVRASVESFSVNATPADLGKPSITDSSKPVM